MGNYSQATHPPFTAHTPQELANHLRQVLDAEWVGFRVESCDTFDEYSVAIAKPTRHTRAKIVKHLDSLWQETRTALNGTGTLRVHSAAKSGQQLVYTHLSIDPQTSCLIAAGLGRALPRRVTSTRSRLKLMGPLLSLAFGLMLTAAQEHQKQESMDLIHRVSRNVAVLQPLDKLIPQVVATIRETFKYDAVSMMLISPTADGFLTKQVAVGEKVVEFLGVAIPITDALEGGIVGYVAHTGQSLLVPDVRQEPRYLKFVEETRCELAVPLRAGERLIGVLDVESNRVNSLDESDRFILEALAGQVAIAIENARLFSELSTARDQIELKTHQLHQLLTRTISIQEEERKRISAELHDGVTQLLISSLYEIQAGRALLPRGSENSETKIASGQDLISDALNEMHRAIHDLRPLMHGDIGMAYALRRLVTMFMASAGVEHSFDIVGEPYKLSPEKEIAAYRITQEAMQNIVKHSEATVVHAQIGFSPHQAILEIRDNGKGFRKSGTNGHNGGDNLGLVNMQERAVTIGGRLDIASALGAGTKITLTIPRDEPAEEPGDGQL